MSEERRHSHDEILARLDERTSYLVSEIKEMKLNFVTHNEFRPVRLIVYGLVSLILASVFGAVLNFFVKR